MRVLSCSRSVSSIVVPQLEEAGARTSDHRFDRASTSRDARNASGTAMRHVRGFSLVELMIGVTVAAILLVIAVPSFQNLTLSNRLTTAANDIVGAINTARMEAIKRNAKTQLCSNSTSSNTSDALGTACGTQTGAVYVLVGSPATASTVLAGMPGIATPIQLSGNVQALRFNAQGLAYAATATAPYSGKVADICTSQMSSNNHRVITMTAGSILATTNGPTGVSCP